VSSAMAEINLFFNWNVDMLEHSLVDAAVFARAEQSAVDSKIKHTPRLLELFRSSLQPDIGHRAAEGSLELAPTRIKPRLNGAAGVAASLIQGGSGLISRRRRSAAECCAPRRPSPTS